MTIAAVILAAGAGSRFEGPDHKLLTEFQGWPMVSWSIVAAHVAGFNQLYVVSGAVDIRTSLSSAVAKKLDDPHGAVVAASVSAAIWLEAEDWEKGQSHSLATGIARAKEDGHSAVVVGLGDQPMVPASAWRSVGSARGQIAVGDFDGDRRPPVKLEHSVWSMLPATGDLGARELMRLHPELVFAVPCGGRAADIDTEKDLELWS